MVTPCFMERFNNSRIFKCYCIFRKTVMTVGQMALEVAGRLAYMVLGGLITLLLIVKGII